MESKEKLETGVNSQENPSTDVAFEPYFDDGTEMGVKISDDVQSMKLNEDIVAPEKDVPIEETVVEDVGEVKVDNVLPEVDKPAGEVKKKKKKRPPEAGTQKKPANGKSKRPEDGAKKKRPAGSKPEGEKSERVLSEGNKPAGEVKKKKKKRPPEAGTHKRPEDGTHKRPEDGAKKKRPTGSKTSGKPVGNKPGSKKSSKKKPIKKGRKISLKTQLIAMVVVPILLVGIVLTVNTATTLRENIVETEKDGLKTTAITLKSTFEGMAGNDTSYVERSSMIYQGDIRITGKDSIVEKIAANGNVQVSFVFGNKRILTSFTDADGNPLTQDGLNGNNQIDDEIYQKVVVGGEEYFDTSVELQGEEYYGYYLPLKNNEGEKNEETVGLIFVGRNSEEIESLITGVIFKAAVICAVLTAVAIFAALYIATNISKMINRVAGSLAKIADGNLVVDIDERILAKGNEIGMIGRASDRLKDSLSGIVGNIKESVDVLTLSASNLEGTSDRTNTTMIEVSKAVEEIADSAGVQAAETEKATTSAMDMGALIENVIHNVEELQSNAKAMGEAEKASTEIIGELSKSNDRTIEAVERIAEQAEYTNVSAQKIKKAVALITSIADETALLSLNASIEAARAGEAGRGFAVVASEISKLAEQSNNSATEIEKIINELLVESNKTVDIMDEVKEIVGEQEEKLNMTKAEFENVSRGIESSVGSVENISGRIVELDIAKNAIIDVIQSLSAISEENAAATEETSASVQELDSTVGSLSEAAKDLKVIAEQLDQQISVFSV